MSRLSLALLEMQRIYSSAGDGGGGEEVNSEDHSPRNETACMSLDHRCGASMRLKELQGGGILADSLAVCQGRRNWFLRSVSNLPQ